MSVKSVLNLLIIGAVLAVLLRIWPAFPGSEPALRITPTGGAEALDLRLMHQVETTLQRTGIAARGLVLDRGGVTVRVADVATRDSAMNALQMALGATCTVLPDAMTSAPVQR